MGREQPARRRSHKIQAAVIEEEEKESVGKIGFLMEQWLEPKVRH